MERIEQLFQGTLFHSLKVFVCFFFSRNFFTSFAKNSYPNREPNVNNMRKGNIKFSISNFNERNHTESPNGTRERWKMIT